MSSLLAPPPLLPGMLAAPLPSTLLAPLLALLPNSLPALSPSQRSIAFTKHSDLVLGVPGFNAKSHVTI